MLASPFLAAIRDHWPRAHIAVMARPKVRAVVERSGVACELVPEREGDAVRLFGAIGAGHFDAAFTLASSLTVPAAFAAARIPIRVGFRGGGRGPFLTHAVPRLPRSLHQTDHYMALGAAAGISRPARTRLCWRVRMGDIAEAGRFLRDAGEGPGGPLAALAPGAAYGPAKRWFAARWARLGDGLSLDFGCRVVLVGGPQETGLAARIAGLMARTPINAAGRLSLAGTAALLARCRVFISTDSGLLHVGAACGVPTLGLFGSSNPRWTGLLAGNGAALWGHVPCAPCYRRTCLPGRDYGCMRALEVKDVISWTAKLLGARRGRN